MHQTIKHENIDCGLSKMRLTRPGQIACMRTSLEKVGQLQPVVVRKHKNNYQLLDGFKRYYASQQLQWERLHAHVLDVDEITAKTMIISYNQQSNSLLDYEQGLVVNSLKQEHLLKQEEIAALLSRSHSWVSRRLSFINRLCEQVQSQLQMGTITPSHARALIKLPRGKQIGFLKVTVENNVTSRQLSLLIEKYLHSKTEQEEAYVLEKPLEVLEKSCFEKEIYDNRLSLQGNRILKTLRILLHYQHILIGQTTTPPLNELPTSELGILLTDYKKVLKNQNTISSTLKPYYDHER